MSDEAFARGLRWSTLSRVAGEGARIAITVLLMRLVAVEAFGLFAMALSVLAFLALLAEAGLTQAVVALHEMTRRKARTAFTLSLLAGAASVTVAAVSAPLVAAFFRDPGVVPVLRWASLGVGFQIVAAVPRGILQREMSFRRLGAVELGAQGIAGVVAVLMALRGLEVEALVLQFVLAGGLGLAFALVASGWMPRPGWDAAIVRRIVGFSRDLTGFNLLNYWTRELDNLLVGRLLGREALGHYGRAYFLMMQPLNLLGAPVRQVLLSSIAVHRMPNAREAGPIFLRALRAYSVIGVAPLLVLGVSGSALLEVVFGPAWLPAAAPLRWLALAGAAQLLLTPLGVVFVAREETRRLVTWGIGASTVLVAAIVVGALGGSMVTVARAYALANVALVVPGLAWTAPLVALQLPEALSGVLPVFVAGLGAAVVGTVAAESVSGAATLVVLAASAGAALGGYGLLLGLFGRSVLADVRTLVRRQAVP